MSSEKQKASDYWKEKEAEFAAGVKIGVSRSMSKTDFGPCASVHMEKSIAAKGGHSL